MQIILIFLITSFAHALTVGTADVCSESNQATCTNSDQSTLLQARVQVSLDDSDTEYRLGGPSRPVYGPYPHQRPLIDYFKNWARGGVESHFERMLEHNINAELLQLDSRALTEAEATMAFSASVEAECPGALAAMDAVAPFSIVHSEPVGDDGLRHVLLKSKTGQLQYLATHRLVTGSVRVMASDPPLCRANEISMPSLLEQEPVLPVVPGVLHSGEKSAGKGQLLDLNDDSVLDCIKLFHRTALDLCHKDFELNVLSATATIIDGVKIHLKAQVCHGNKTECRLHSPECNFETQADHADASFLQSGGVPGSHPGNTIHAEQAGLTATLTLHVPLCTCDVTDGATTTDHIDAGLMETFFFGENSRYKGHEHDNDDLPKWSALEVQTGQSPTDVDLRISYPSCFPAIPGKVAGTEVVRNQGTCGSCWAFAGATTAMTNLCTSTNSVSGRTHNGDTDRTEVSVQKIMSCKPTGASTQRGCNGGNMGAFTKSANLWGLTAEKENLYRCGGGNALNHFTQTSSKCDAYPWAGYCSGTPRAEWFWGGAASVTGADAIATYLQNGLSLYASFTVYSNFMSWRKEIYTEARGNQLGGHAVNLMGYGVDAGTKYWLVQNSWGTNSWGHNGFGRFLRGTNLVGIETEAYVVRAWLQGGTPAPCMDSNDGTGLSSNGHPPYIPCSQALNGRYGNLCTRYPTAALRCMKTCGRCDGTNGANAPPSPPTPGQAPAPAPVFSKETGVPTTEAPTTAAATTEEPTTGAPTTEKATTEAMTTEGALQNLGASGCTSSSKCGRCQGDCDRDSDCDAGLFCFQRDRSSQVVPGCKAGGIGDVGAYDYCAKDATTAWTKATSKHCYGSRLSDRYTNLRQAKNACLLNPQCNGVYDGRCDNRGSFYMCRKDQPWARSSSSCVYQKPEASTTEAPTTEAPTTQAPTTEAPTTKAPTTEAPTTEARDTHFSQADLNKDAVITRDEWNAAVQSGIIAGGR